MSLKVTLISHTPNCEELVTKSAKLCYSASGVEDIQKNLTPQSIEKFIQRITSFGHYSVLEHINFTFAIEGVSRVLTHQLVRHRLASYSQQSQRYVKLQQFEYIIPEKIKNNKNAKKIFIKAMRDSQESYNKIVDTLLETEILNYITKYNLKQFNNSTNLLTNFKNQYKKEFNSFEKKCIEDARYVFPNACETKIMLTMNARSLLNFFTHRCCNRAQTEIRLLAWEMLRQVKSKAPNVFYMAGPSCMNNNCPEGNMSCGHPYSKCT